MIRPPYPCPTCGEETGPHVLPNSSCPRPHNALIVPMLDVAARVTGNLYAAVLFGPIGDTSQKSNRTYTPGDASEEADQYLLLALAALDQAQRFFTLAHIKSRKATP